METIIDLVVGFVVGLVLWQLIVLVYNVYIAYKAVKLIDKRIEEAVAKQVESIKVIEVNIEKHQDIYYLFEKDTDRFIAQGKTKDELAEAIHARFKGYKVLTQEEQLKAHGLNW